ncbi:Rne/Rng family ribonuclease [Waterburya agarophytonicola K14]|uniref:Rne/Rng family ribonuclease n=1 Tax=Waterburya agarophytonicola KI4 TaxID=2874699 RepID=A0A964FFD2_9CYAN|nr:Rne/Rng family ribonuclease [Waterburya agarophytonicola]MCC0175694.1 Rne/Rng family ribonuclease [Waterburya agarophytonicola KI4]
MPKQIIIAEQHHIAAVFWEEQIQELIVATGHQQVSDIYLGTVENIIPGIDAAFVNIGDSERNGFIHVTDLGPLRLKKSAAAITELLVPQQKALVQVMKEPTGNKGPRLTGNITLPGRYLVLMPYGKGVKLSRRIKDENERSRLRALAILIKPPGMGLLIRTEADGKAEEAIMEDLEFLQKQWESIQYQANYAKPPALLNRDDDFIQRVLRDTFSAEVNTIVVDSGAGVKRIKQQLANWSGGRSPQGVFIDSHREQQPILDYYRVNAAIREALKPRVELPSGGYIIIEPTEALTVIDVNSGSFTRSATARETVLWTNTEAATEIARQLRLRNIGGVIVVDFIDMDSHRDKIKLLEHFNKSLKGDKARPQIAQLSELGLVELTRKRQGKNIYELFGQICHTCGGLGQIAHLPGKQEAEALETVAVVPPAAIREPVNSIRPMVIPPPTAKSERIELANNSTSEPVYDGENSSLDSIDRPNYQDRENGNNGNRRRRRSRRNDLLIKDELIEAENNENLDRDNNGSNEERKSRGSGRSARRDEASLEKVTVEMGELEQEIYALMGVSPLVYADRESSDPKSVLVYVKKPGEELSELETTKASEEVLEAPPEVEDAKPKTRTRKIKTKTQVEPVIETTPEVGEEIFAEQLELAEPEVIAEETTTKVRRRRRRRSSAPQEVEV